MEDMEIKKTDEQIVDPYWKGKRVFVTGATGFLGSWITKYLVESGAHVTPLVRDKVFNANFFLLGLDKKTNVVEGELEDYELIKRSLPEYEIDTIFHVGAQPIVNVGINNPKGTFKANIEGTWNVLEAARHSPSVKRIVVASSDKAYGPQDILPYEETAPLKGRFPYDVSKSCVDLITQAYFHTYGLPVALTRCGNLYGPGDLNFSRIVPGTFRSIMRNENPIIRSDGTFKRDYFFIKDAVSGYLTIAKSLDKKEIHGEVFNLSPERPCSVIELFNKMIAISEKTHLQPVILNEAKMEIKDQYLSCEKAKRVLNWSPQWTVDEGLKEAYEWYKWFFISGTGANY